MEFVLAEAVNGAFIERKDGHEVSADVGMCAGWNKSRLKEEMLFVVFVTWSEVGFEPVYRIWSPALAPLIKFWRWLLLCWRVVIRRKPPWTAFASQPANKPSRLIKDINVRIFVNQRRPSL